MTAQSVLICVDDPQRRRLLAEAVAAAPGVEAVQAVAADEPAVRAAAAGQPALVLVEALRAWLDGAKVVGCVRSVAPGAAVVAVAPAHDRPRTFAARAMAADRYLEPGVEPSEAVEALCELARAAALAIGPSGSTRTTSQKLSSGSAK